MTVELILKRNRSNLVTCTPDDPVEAVAKLLTDHRIGALPVVDGAGRLVGVISERDLVRGVAAKGAAMLRLYARDLMTRDVATCTPRDSIKDVMLTMSRRHIRHLPVMADGRLKDMLSQRDVMQARLEETQLEVNVLRDVALAHR
jgi:CBS domain-containing protein